MSAELDRYMLGVTRCTPDDSARRRSRKFSRPRWRRACLRLRGHPGAAARHRNDRQLLGNDRGVVRPRIERLFPALRIYWRHPWAIDLFVTGRRIIRSASRMRVRSDLTMFEEVDVRKHPGQPHIDFRPGE